MSELLLVSNINSKSFRTALGSQVTNIPPPPPIHQHYFKFVRQNIDIKIPASLSQECLIAGSLYILIPL